MIERRYVIAVTSGLDSARAALRGAAGHVPLDFEASISRRTIAVTSVFGATATSGNAEFAAMLFGEGLRLTTPDVADLTVVIVDDYLQPGLSELAHRHAERGQKWLPFKPAGLSPFLGPVIAPFEEQHGCYHCLARRVGEHRPGDRILANTLRAPRPARGVTPASRAFAGARAALLLTDYMAGGNIALQDQLHAFPAGDGATTKHAVIRFPNCPVCGSGHEGDSNPQPIRLTNVATADGAEMGWRALSQEEALRRLQKIVSPITGIVSALTAVHPVDGLFIYSATQGNAVPIDPRLNRTLGKRGGAGGKGTSDIQARISCLGEAVERYSAHWTGGEPRRTASWGDLGAAAPS